MGKIYKFENQINVPIKNNNKKAVLSSEEIAVKNGDKLKKVNKTLWIVSALKLAQDGAMYNRKLLNNLTEL